MANKVLFAMMMPILFASPAVSQVNTAPQTGQYDIRGRLVFPTPKPPEDRIEINLERNMQRIQTVFADSLGNFEFRSVPPGDYYVSIKLPDFEDVNQSVSVMSTQRTTTTVIQMNPLFTVRRTRAPGFEGDDPDVIDVKMMTKSYPRKAVQAYEKALEESRKGRTDGAVKFLEEAVKLAPDFYHAQNNLGVAYLKLNRFRDAEAAYRHAMDINPKAQQPLINLGILFITEADARKEEGRPVAGKLLDDAMDALDAAIKIKPRSAVAHFYLGTAYYKSEFFDESETSLKKAQEYDPNMANVRVMLVNLYIKQRRFADALKQIDAFLREYPKAEERLSMQDLRAKIAKGLEP